MPPSQTLCFISMLIVCCVGCFEPIADPIELPFEEKLVIRGILIAGDVISDIQISRTLPPLDTFSYQKIFVDNAKAELSVDGRTHQMELQPIQVPSTATVVIPRSLYRVPNLRAESGKTYSLRVEWKSPTGKTLVAQATTRVPLAPVLDSVRVLPGITSNRNNTLDTVFATEAFIRTRAGEAIRVGTLLINSLGQTVSSRGYGDVLYFERGQISLVRSNNWQFTTGTVQVLEGMLRCRAVVEVYDTEYYRYYQTRNRSGQPSPLNPGGPNIEWNVAGDGIGMFVGMAQAQRIAPVRRQ